MSMSMEACWKNNTRACVVSMVSETPLNSVYVIRIFISLFPMDIIFHSTTDAQFLLLSHIIIFIYFVYGSHIFQRVIYHIYKRAPPVCHCDRRWVGLIFLKRKNAKFCSTYVYTPKVGRTHTCT